MRTFCTKLLVLAMTVVGLGGIVSASDFFETTLTLQGINLDLGEAGRTADYAVFATKTFTAHSSYTGAQGMGGNVGVENGSLDLYGGSVLNGTATAHQAKNIHVQAGSVITGSRFQRKLNDAAKDARTFADRAATLRGTMNYTATAGFSSNLSLSHSAMTITATDASPVVLKLDNFALDAGTFTLVGTAMSKFIINIDQGLTLTNGSRINLSGGLLAGNVVFNVDRGDITVRDSQASGILLAVKATATLTNSTLDGQLIARNVTLKNGSRVKKPGKPSP